VLLVYRVTLLGNSLIPPHPGRRCPALAHMHFFLRHFSVAGLLYTKTIVPRMLADLLSSVPAIPPTGCFTQLYFSLPVIAERGLLTAMASDRYAAVCRQLHHSTLM
ncbi:hypothetical protein DBR06_SOUSAS2310032, partial [Sousa chinensis]